MRIKAEKVREMQKKISELSSQVTVWSTKAALAELLLLEKNQTSKRFFKIGGFVIFIPKHIFSKPKFRLTLAGNK